jgi:hypothetical protein
MVAAYSLPFGWLVDLRWGLADLAQYKKHMKYAIGDWPFEGICVEHSMANTIPYVPTGAID